MAGRSVAVILVVILHGARATCGGQAPDFHCTQQDASDDAPWGTEFLQHQVIVTEKPAPSSVPLATPITHTLFLKIHKTSSSAIRDYLLKFFGPSTSENCNEECGCPNYRYTKEVSNVPCEVPPQQVQADELKCLPGEVMHSCIGHPSLEVVRLGLARQKITSVLKDLSDPSNLIPDSQRYSGLLSHAPFTQAWLPLQWSNALSLRIVTVMRDPPEKLRSQYYYDLHSRGRIKQVPMKHSNFVLMLKEQLIDWPGNQTDHMGINYDYIKQRNCCEYWKSLGNWSVDQAKLVLTTHFDLVGITERFDETLLSLARMYGVSAAKLASFSVDQNAGPEKLDWTPEEYSLAKQVTAMDAEIYSFARELFQRQILSMWGAQDNLDVAIREYHALQDSDSANV